MTASMLKVRVLASVRELQGALAEIVEWAETIDFAYAWMSSGKHGRGFWNVLKDEKIRYGIVGHEFGATEPFVLEHFMRTIPGRVHVVTDERGTFHPKFLLAAKGGDRRAILGSSNFTSGGFTHNTEINVLLQGRANDAAFRELERVIEEYWDRSEPITREILALCRKAWTRRARPRPFHLPAAKTRTGLDLSWHEYCTRLQRAARHWQATYGAEDTYLSELGRVRRILRDADGFGDLLPDEARVVAGFGPRVGWFGSTRAAGTFMHLVKRHPTRIAPLIDPIPLDGDVSDDLVKEAFRAAKRLDRVGIGCVTRLLSVARPDKFYSVNSKNRARIRKVFGVAPKTVEQYLEVLAVIRELRWYQSTRPRGARPQELAMWKARVALLDMLFYEPG